MKRIVLIFVFCILILASCGKETSVETPTNTTSEVYIDLASDYINKKDYESAIDILQKGLENTNDEAISTMLKEVLSKQLEKESDDKDIESNQSNNEVVEENIKNEFEKIQCDHEYISEVTTVATCVKEGVKTFICSVCKDSYTEKISATGNCQYISEVTTVATCVKEGIKTFTCSVCKDSYTEKISATGNHQYISEVTTAATDINDGVKTFTCYECDDSYTEIIPAVYQRQNAMVLEANLEMNTVNGVSVEIVWRNNSEKTIKYIDFYAIPYNAVNDPVSCEISGASEKILSSTGPHYAFDKNNLGKYPYFYNKGIRNFVNTEERSGRHYLVTSTTIDLNTFEPIHTKRYLTDNEYEYVFDIKCNWGPAWYNSTIRSIVITKIEIQYMDGTSEIIEKPPIWKNLLINSVL